MERSNRQNGTKKKRGEGVAMKCLNCYHEIGKTTNNKNTQWKHIGTIAKIATYTGNTCLHYNCNKPQGGTSMNIKKQHDDKIAKLINRLAGKGCEYVK